VIDRVDHAEQFAGAFGVAERGLGVLGQRGVVVAEQGVGGELDPQGRPGCDGVRRQPDLTLAAP